MAFGNSGMRGTAAHSTSASSFTLTTTNGSIALASNHFALLVVVTDNSSTTDGDNNEHTSVTGGTGTWTKLGEHCNSNGAANAGTVVSLWMFTPTASNASGTVFTINRSDARIDKCASLHCFQKAATQSVRQDTESSLQTNSSNASNGFGSVSFSGLSSQARLYFRAMAKEANSTTQITPSTSFTAISGTRSRNHADAQMVQGEFRINTSTGETSNPALAVSGDTAGIFVALEEYTATGGARAQATIIG